MKRTRRSQGQPPTVSLYKDWMEYYRIVMMGYSICDIFNCDESGWARFACKEWVVTEKRMNKKEKNVTPRLAGVDYRDHVTIMSCVSANGRYIQPLFIIKAQSEKTYHNILSKETGASVIATSNVHMLLFELN